ncbi:assimilatory sulfite reductase (NADPH) flavoprotein subunit [Psychrobium sp. 1_MG-2023]|uniref:assimilatory sulfite reductase (NADPH) flavoprotein subunit n=1 Tax=Psychrobium sp. 1_MG-2023 TaxID=3062624 RepID=UPI000C320F88|nr:assimilatory sulfite reductase (NADPH) flavoprotein subunit [Psychrobium sp. 1_MG-2023]MDP2560098.1 assimilatory sulfite reductase (NADPH) flavoprotein subunit [Psychrobium sp. 1_MG-2023]PKF56244.1 assimilatory sulfite reductase (NADPH) flavoprotein subunit [Alteromonadales bacterium alter-6D02]
MLIQQLNSLSSPLSQQQVDSLKQLTATMSAVELSWVSGYLAGISQGASGAVAAPAEPAGKLTVLFGSQTGNAKGVATQVAAAAKEQGINVELVSMANYKTKQLKAETHLLVVVSTNGEGEPPDDAIQLHEFLGGKRAPKLDGLSYSVLGLGDTSYEFFCQTAIDFDQRLAALGAKSVVERKDCDVDYDDDVLAWQEQALAAVKETLSAQPSAAAPAFGGAVASAESQYTKKNPYKATLLASPKITGRGANRDVRHIEISLEDSGITYQPGDALGVWFDNDPALVAELVELLSLDAEQSVELNGEQVSLTQALVQGYELTQLHPGFVAAYGEATGQDELVKLAEDKATVRDFIEDRQVIDVVRQYPAAISVEALLGALRKLTPRLYSIASAMSEVEEEVHLTVGVVEYTAFDKVHQGAASSFLGHRLEEDSEVRVFIEHNDNFRLPAEDKPVIMVGPGTGIAPFRSFLQERDNQDASGESWLFFGNQHFTDDFLYQTELQDFKERGVLNRIDLAFSRDQEHKVYVQHRIIEQGKDLYQWLENGASLYICGDGSQMAKDVHQAFVDVIVEHGNKTEDQAQEYLIALRDSKRYQKDVY